MVADHPLQTTAATPLRRIAILAFVALSLAGFRPAHAQIDTLAREITDATTQLSESQVEAVNRYADRYLQQLEAGASLPPEDSTAESARKMLQSPLLRASTTPPFRLAYSRLIIDRLRAIAEGSSPAMAIQALQVAGDLATDAAVAVSEGLLNSPDDSIRLSSAAALRKTYEAVALSAPAVNPTRLEASLRAIGKALEGEANLDVVRALTEAATAAMRIDRANHESVRSAAAASLSNSLGARVRELSGSIPDEKLLVSMVAAAASIRDSLAIGGRVDANSSKSAAGFAGDLLVNLSKTVNRGGLSTEPADQDPARGRAVQLALLAEQIISLSQTRLGGQSSPIDLSNRLRSGAVNDDAAFTLDVARVCERLTKPPFDHRADRFR